MRIGSWLFLVVGAACLIAAVVLGIHAAQQAAEISGYQHARPCPAGAPPNASCLRTVEASVTDVTEFPGGYRISPVYALDVRTGAQTLHLTFTSDNPVLGYAADGDPAVVTMWRGVPVSVMTNGRSAVTAAVPRTALAHDSDSSEQAVAVGAFSLLGGLAIRWNRRAGEPASPALLLALLLAGLVAEAGAIALDGKPSRLGPDLAGTGAGLAVALGFAASVGVSRLRERHAASFHPAAPSAGGTQLPAKPVPSSRHGAGRRRPAVRARVLVGRAVSYIPMVLAVAVLFGVLFTSKDGPPARAYRQAPPCVAETNLATCAGDFTAVINGVRTPVNGSDFAEVSYATSDDAINTWARFDGDAPVIARAASADENAGTPVRIRVWRRSIVGAEFGGGWHWADGDPPGNTNATLLLAISFALLLLTARLRIHRRAGPTGDSAGLMADDLGQAAVAAGGVVLLAWGFWPGAIPVLAALAWLGLSASRSTQRKPATVAALQK